MNKKNQILIFSIILSFLLYPIYPAIGATQETKESLTAKINSTTEQIKLLEKEIQQYQSQINETNKESTTLSGLIKELTLTRDKLLKEVNQTEKKINLASDTITSLETNIKEKSNEISATQEVLRKSLYELYQKDQIPLVEIILQKDGLKGASRDYQDKIALNKKINSFIDLTLEIKSTLENTKQKKEFEHEKLSSLKDQLSQEKKAVDIARSEKDKVLKETKNKEAEYKKILAERQRMRDQFAQEINDYESKLQFLLNPTLLPTTGHGTLVWPLKNVLITQLFGKTASSGRLYASGTHSGVDLRASVGTPVYAMRTGVVMGTGDTDIYCKGASFGKWVFIQYDNGLSSTFGHLSSIIAKKGQVVKAGDLVALSGNTGHSTGPHLHITVYASQGAEITEFPSKSCPGAKFIMPIAPKDAYLDPMLYFPETTKDMYK